jgi:hypothetical protein
MTLRLLPEASTAVSQAIFLTGAMRTGTTMMARLVGSFAGTEIFIEPPLCYVLLPLIEDLPREQWQLLFEAALYEDCLLPALAGRNLNLNKADLTHILTMKEPSDVEARQRTPHKHRDLVEASLQSRIAFKIPEMTHLAGTLSGYYPQMKMLATVRQPESVVASILIKGWFDDSTLTGPSLKWPLKSDRKFNFPFWLEPKYESDWKTMTPIDRCCLAYIHQYDKVDAATFNLIIDYDRFVQDAKSDLGKICDFFGMNFGPKTDSLLGDIREPKKDRTLDWGKADPSLKQKMDGVYNRLVDCALG